MEDREIVVSVWCQTYNHSNYIRDALDGFVNQKTDFRYEVFVYDDASTDGTTEIIKEYEKRYPHIIKGIYQKENQYSTNKPEWHGTLPLMREYLIGRYIAFCEGDDFWIDESKLQRQVEFMEKHPECALVGHEAVRLDCIHGHIDTMSLYSDDAYLSDDELFCKWSLPTASCLYRSNLLDINGFFLEVGIADLPMALFARTKGKVYFSTRIMSVYRWRHVGSWTYAQRDSERKQLISYKNLISFLLKYNIETNGMCYKSVRKNIMGYVSSAALIISCSPKAKEYVDIFDEFYDVGDGAKIKDIVWTMSEILGREFIDADTQDYVFEKERVYIYGAGKYGKLLEKQLRKGNIDIDGFIVTQKEDDSEFLDGKKIWEIDEIKRLPEEQKKKTAIIVAMGLHWGEEVRESLSGDELEVRFLFDDIIQIIQKIVPEG